MFSYSDEFRIKKAFKYVKRMLPLFRAVAKCSVSSPLSFAGHRGFTA